jgi:hypothetical protein
MIKARECNEIFKVLKKIEKRFFYCIIYVKREGILKIKAKPQNKPPRNFRKLYA